MKTLAAAILLSLSLAAFAGMWSLIHSELVGSNMYCTYRLQGGSYEKTIVMPIGQMCRSLISD